MNSLFFGLYSALSALMRRLRHEDGQTMAEYGILIAVIAIIVVAVAVTLGGNISGVFSNASSHL